MVVTVVYHVIRNNEHDLIRKIWTLRRLKIVGQRVHDNQLSYYKVIPGFLMSHFVHFKLKWQLMSTISQGITLL